MATASEYRSLLRSAGFIEIEVVDVTAAYLDTARAWLRHGQHFAAELTALEPPGAFADRLTHRRWGIAAIEASLLRRSLFVATRPSRRGFRHPTTPVERLLWTRRSSSVSR